MADQSPKPPEGAVVEWYAQPSGYRTGIVANLPAERRIGRVNHYRPDGSACVYDADGVRAIVRPERLTVLAERAEAGWSQL